MYDFHAQHPEFDWSKFPVPAGKPFVVFIVTRNPGKPTSFKEPWVFNLDHTAGTYDHILRYQLKGFEPIGYGNLLASNPAPGATATSDNMSDEHAKIKAHIDQILGYKSQLHAKMQAELAGDRATIEARVEAEVQKLLAQRLEEERLKREAEEQELKKAAEAAYVAANEAEAEKPAKKK